jgi:hypothetical protein
MFWFGILTGVLQGLALWLWEKVYAPQPMHVPHQ